MRPDDAIASYSDSGMRPCYLRGKILHCFFHDGEHLVDRSSGQGLFTLASVTPFRRTAFPVFDCGQRRVSYEGQRDLGGFALMMTGDGTALG